MKCSKCGARLSGNIQFCSYCGTKVENKFGFLGKNFKKLKSSKKEEISKLKNDKTTQQTENVSEYKTDKATSKDSFISFWKSSDLFSKIAIISIVVASLLFVSALSNLKIMPMIFSLLQLGFLTAALSLHKGRIKSNKKWLKYLALALAVVLIIPNTSSYSQFNNTDSEKEIIESFANINTPYGVSDCLGKDKDTVKNDLISAGFYNISEETIEDLEITEAEKFGIVESVSINGVSDFENNTKFDSSSKVIIKYHSYKCVAIPFSSEEIKSKETDAILQALGNAGFTIITTDEKYDLDPDVTKSEFENRISVNETGTFEKGEKFPINSDIKVTTHKTYEKYTLKLIVDFVPNLIFSKYDVNLEIDDNVETLKHGKDGNFEYRLKAGEYTVTFTNAESSSVKGEVEIELSADTEATYKIWCYSDEISIETVSVEKNDKSDTNNEINTTTSESVDVSNEKTENTETTVEHKHTWNEATCTSPKTCSDCGETSGSALGHNYSSGKCTRCGQKDPNYQSTEMVWIPTNGGTKYHSKSSCSKMINPEQVTKSEAISRGFSPCGRCY